MLAHWERERKTGSTQMNMPLYQIDIKNFEYGRHKIVQFCCMRPNAWEHIWENWTFFVLEKICCVSVLIMWDVEIDESIKWSWTSSFFHWKFRIFCHSTTRCRNEAEVHLLTLSFENRFKSNWIGYVRTWKIASSYSSLWQYGLLAYSERYKFGSLCTFPVWVFCNTRNCSSIRDLQNHFFHSIQIYLFISKG